MIVDPLCLFLREIAFFYSIINTYRILNECPSIAKDRICSDNRMARATQIPSQVRGIKSLALFRPRVNPITFFDSRLLAGTHTRLPSDRSVERAIRVARDVTARDGCTYVRTYVYTVLRSREADSKRDCGLPAVASVRARATTETYETITNSDFDPRGDQLHARGGGPKKCRGLDTARAPPLCNSKIVTSF